MKRWTEAEDAELRDGIIPQGRTEAACDGRAQRLGQSLMWSKAKSLRAHVGGGGFVIKEDVGGSVGVYWGDATRSGLTFDAAHCERMCRDGDLIQFYKDRPNIYSRRAHLNLDGRS